MFKDYIEVRDWLEQFIPLVYGKEELGLKRITYLLNLLGNPERKFKSIHVAGTSGKGSTAYYAAKLLSSQFTVHSSQIKVGLHISPHLVDIRERMQVFGGIGESEESENRKFGEGSLMSIGKFLKLFEQVRPVVEKIQKEKPELVPSYFEILAAASFKYFAEEKVDWAVIEVGLGGRLDATNVLMPEVSVITNIGLDHTEILGDTVEKIAAEKAGIIKLGVPVVTGASGSAFRVIKDMAKGKGAAVYRIKSNDPRDANLGLAEKAVEVVTVKKLSLKHRGLGGLLGRFESIDDDVILDGAHNPDKIQSLIDFVRNSKFEIRNSKQSNILRESVSESRSRNSFRQARTIKNIILVLAFKKGKDWQKMVDLLIKNLPVVQVIATEFNAVTDTGKFGAVSGKEIKDYLDTKFKIPDTRYYLNSQEAVFAALQSTINNQQSTIVLVTGSLYLVGEARTMWRLPEF